LSGVSWEAGGPKSGEPCAWDAEPQQNSPGSSKADQCGNESSALALRSKGGGLELLVWPFLVLLLEDHR